MGRILLLHGVGSSAAVWWRMQRDLTELGHHVTAVDLLGHGGRTDGPDGPWTVEAFARDVVERAEPVDVVAGHSLGAIVALAAAALRPEFAGAVVIEDPPGGQRLDQATVAAGLGRLAAEARADADAAVAGILADNPAWAVLDARHMVAARQGLDVVRVADFLRGDPLRVDALVRECPVPVHLLLADGPGSALSEPVRSELVAALGDRVTTVASGHSIYRERPGMWLRAVTRVLAG